MPACPRARVPCCDLISPARTGILAAKARVATARASRGALATADVLDLEVSAG